MFQAVVAAHYGDLLLFALEPAFLPRHCVGYFLDGARELFNSMDFRVVFNRFLRVIVTRTDGQSSSALKL